MTFFVFSVLPAPDSPLKHIQIEDYSSSWKKQTEYIASPHSVEAAVKQNGDD